MRDGVAVLVMVIVFLAVVCTLAFHEANKERDQIRDCDKRHGVYLIRDAACADSILVRY